MAADTREFRDSNLYIVPRIADGVSVAGRFDGLGPRANDSAPMRLDVEIDAGSRLDVEASGSRFEHLDSTLADLPTIRAYLSKAWTDLAAHKALLRETAGLRILELEGPRGKEASRALGVRLADRGDADPGNRGQPVPRPR